MTGLICNTLECNLSCSYCFEGNGICKHKPNVGRVNNLFEDAIPLFDRFIDELYYYNGERFTTIIWHGGEPTLINPELMMKVMALQKTKGHSIRWAIQTNGTIIGKPQIEMFKQYDVNVGISLDGLQKSHDANRVTKDGKPTFDLIMSNIRNLISNGIKPNILLTINDSNVNDLKDIYEYIIDEYKLNMSFNALYPSVYDNSVDLDSDCFAQSVNDLFDMWISDNDNKSVIIPFLRIMEGLLFPNDGIGTCHWRRDCSKTMIAIDTNGDLFNCEHWVDKKQYSLGNIKEGLAECIRRNNIFSERAERLKNSDCVNCEIYNLCYGGCPSNAFELFGSTDRYDQSVCLGRRAIIRHIYDYMCSKGVSGLPEYSVYGSDK